jgi:S-DNA-T family DNA segregation ATPase FtsK/SpoIIIE
MRRLIARNLRGAAGLAIIAGLAGVAVALATWSAADPSLSNATRAPAHNALGFFGASIADLMIDRKSTRLNSSHNSESRMPSSA